MEIAALGQRLKGGKYFLVREISSRAEENQRIGLSHTPSNRIVCTFNLSHHRVIGPSVKFQCSGFGPGLP
jgi:hypothetical protein